MTPIVWWSARDDVPARGYWDQQIVEWLAGRLNLQSTSNVPDGGAAVVVVPAAGSVDQVGELNADLERLDRSVVILTSDEGSHFRVDELAADRIWVQYPRSDRHPEHIRALPVGWTPHTTGWTWRHAPPPPDKTAGWFFAGQITHPRRKQAARVARTMHDGQWIGTAEFTGGLDRDDYLGRLAAAKVAPCPAGIVSPDTFRTWEALQLGCVPAVDIRAGEWDVPADYWRRLLGPDHPLPTVDEWTELPGIVDEVCEGWPSTGNGVSAWWLAHKQALAARLARDVDGPLTFGPPITVLIPTSPIPSHPDTSIIVQTIGSVRERLPDAPIVVMADGVRTQQTHRDPDYREYLRRLLWYAHHRWDGVTVQIAEKHLHQVGLTRRALDTVTTPAVLFVEHDTPLDGPSDIPWGRMVSAVLGDRADVVRLHHEAKVLEPHRHLMLDDGPTDLAGVPVWRTVQWSQRPHLASTAFYRRIVADCFAPHERWMIEDRMHSVVQTAYDLHGEAGWDRYRLWLYHPEGDIRRSGHLDGRGDDPKWTDR